MKWRISTIGCVWVILACVFLFPSIASAVPSLVVAPGAPNDGNGIEDIYMGDYEDYLATFAETFESGEDGFFLRPSGGLVSVVYGANNGNPALNQEIFIATDATYADGDFTFGGRHFQELVDGLDQADGYKPLPYWGVSLGSIGEADNPNDGWVKFEDPNYPGQWFINTAPFEYHDMEFGDWLFAFRDQNSNNLFDDSEEFSRKTTSSTVPDASVVFLLGSALIGLFALGKRKDRE